MSPIGSPYVASVDVVYAVVQQDFYIDTLPHKAGPRWTGRTIAMSRARAACVYARPARRMQHNAACHLTKDPYLSS